MIIYRSFYREAAVTTLATMLVLTVLVLSQKAVVMLSSAAAGNIKATWVMTLLLLDLFMDFDLLIQLSLFVGVLATLNRWYRDSEMVVLTSCGIGIMDLVRPVMKFTLIIALLVAVLVLVVRPAAFSRIQDIRQESMSKTDLALVVPGSFNTANGYVYYIEPGSGKAGARKKVADNKPEANVFIHNQDSKEHRTIIAQQISQRLDQRTGERKILLGEGSIFQGQPGQASYQVSHFDTYELVLPPDQDRKPIDNVESVSMLDLLAFPDRNRALAELHTRLGKPVMLFVFAGIAMVLAYSEPRRSHYLGLFIAVLVFFSYLTILQTIRDLMQTGQISPYLGLWWVHGIAAIIIYRLLRRRSQGLPLWPWPIKVSST